MAFFLCKFGWWLVNKFSLLFLISFILDARGRVFSRFADRFTVPMNCGIGYWIVTIVPYLIALSLIHHLSQLKTQSGASPQPFSNICHSSIPLSEFPNQSSWLQLNIN